MFHMLSRFLFCKISQRFDDRIEEFAAKYTKLQKKGAKRSRSIAKISVSKPNVLTRKSRRLNESLMASICEDNGNDETLPITSTLLDKTRVELLDSSAAGANVTYVVDKTSEAVPKDATFIITDDNNNNEVEQQQGAVRKKKRNREGTPLTSMLDGFASKGVVPKRLADITNTSKANDSNDDSNSFFKVPMHPVRPVPGLKRIANKKEISFDDLNSDDETDVESNQEKRAQIFPQWSLDYKRMKWSCKQAYVNFDGEHEVPHADRYQQLFSFQFAMRFSALAQ